MFLLFDVKIVPTRSNKLYTPAELWSYATNATPDDNTDCEYVAHMVPVNRDNVDTIMSEIEQIENFAGWIVPLDK